MERHSASARRLRLERQAAPPTLLGLAAVPGGWAPRPPALAPPHPRRRTRRPLRPRRRAPWAVAARRPTARSGQTHPSWRRLLHVLRSRARRAQEGPAPRVRACAPGRRISRCRQLASWPFSGLLLGAHLRFVRALLRLVLLERLR